MILLPIIHEIKTLESEMNHRIYIQNRTIHIFLREIFSNNK
jgi:hypothetical protein